MIMGATYLSYSAYFLSNSFSDIKIIMNVVILLIYVGLGSYNAKSLLLLVK
jgi:hypothetical protein